MSPYAARCHRSVEAGIHALDILPEVVEPSTDRRVTLVCACKGVTQVGNMERAECVWPILANDQKS